MRQRNVRRRQARRYLQREVDANRHLYFMPCVAAECRAFGHLPRWHLLYPMSFYGEDDPA